MEFKETIINLLSEEKMGEEIIKDKKANSAKSGQPWIIAGAILLGFVILTLGLYFALSSSAVEYATIDTDKVAEKSKLSEKINQELQSKRDEIRTKISQATTAAEKQQLELEFEKFRLEKNREFIGEVKKAIAAVSSRKGIKLVASPQAFLYAENDLTDEVIKELDNN